MRIATPSRTTELLRRYEKHAAKRYGQNFLIDLSVVDRIAANAKLQPTTTVLEIGSGLGALSEACALSGAQVISYEIDDALIPILSESMATYPNVKIIHEDFLSADLSTFRTCDDLVVLANLPYYITTPILMKLMRDDLPIRQLNLMMQKEVAQRMSALPGTAEYGSLSVFIQFHFALKRLMVVKRTCFLPAPKVDSVVLTLTPRVREPLIQPSLNLSAGASDATKNPHQQSKRHA